MKIGISNIYYALLKRFADLWPAKITELTAREALQTGCAAVNLPHFVKAYSGRAVEGMSAGQPVISWEIPDRPRNRALFEDDQEILLYPEDNPSRLATQIKRVLSNPNLGRQIAENARCKLRRFHTMEERVQQILDWVETGETPTYV